MTEKGPVRVGQLWRRRRDGKAFIPAHHAGGWWFNKAGNKRSCADLRDKYVLVPIDDDTAWSGGEPSVNTSPWALPTDGSGSTVVVLPPKLG